jgi:AraC-like DNA-binding protein
MLRDGELPVSEIAATTGMSTYHFIRQFRAVLGETPNQYRIRCRMEMAKRKLVVGRESITDICMAVGYSSLGSFSALFARRFGRSPTLYRQQYIGKVEELTPHCLSLLRAAWARESQFSRSEVDST